MVVYLPLTPQLQGILLIILCLISSFLRFFLFFFLRLHSSVLQNLSKAFNNLLVPLEVDQMIDLFPLIFFSQKSCNFLNQSFQVSSSLPHAIMLLLQWLLVTVISSDIFKGKLFSSYFLNFNFDIDKKTLLNFLRIELFQIFGCILMSCLALQCFGDGSLLSFVLQVLKSISKICLRGCILVTYINFLLG